MPRAAICAATGRAPLAVAPIELVRRADRPTLAAVVREGDPRAAVAALVLTGADSYASTGLAAVLEARVRAAGFAADSRADRDGARVRALVETAERAAQFVTAVRAALAAPIAPESAGLDLVSRRWAALRRHPWEAPIADSLAACTGALGVLATDAPPDSARDAGVARLESARRAAFASVRVAFGVVGASSFAASVGDALQSGDAWPTGAPIEGVGSADELAAAFASTGVAAGAARVTVALAMQRAESAVAAADQVGDAGGALAARLRALAAPFRLVDVSGSARPRGGCVAVTMESSKSAAAAGRVEEAGAAAALVAIEEVELARGRPENRAGGARAAPGYEATRAVRSASDPRDAAELAARWALTTALASSDEPSLMTVVALAVAGSAAPGEASLAAQRTSSTRLSAALARLRDPSRRRRVERRDRIERGQGELWLLLGSPCGTASEGPGDAGSSALALSAALAARGSDVAAVTLEPWVTPDGVGVIAHAAPLPEETSAALAERVASQAARTLAVASLTPTHFGAARGALLARLGEGVATEGRALEALAGALVPGHASWVLPLGSWEPLTKAGVDAVSLKWTELLAGPLRLAVLANSDGAQSELAVQVIERWVGRPDDPARACQAAEEAASPRPGTVTVTLASPPPMAQALVGVPVPGEGAPMRAFAELTLAGLAGDGGWLGKALGSLNATGQARLWGGTRAAALVVDVRASDANLDAAVMQVRALLQRLAQGAMTAADLARATALRDRSSFEESLDPRERLVDLWRGPADAAASPVPPPVVVSAGSLDGWRSWASSALRDDNLIVVLAKPKR